MKTIILTLSLGSLFFTGASVALVSRGARLPEPAITVPDGAFYVEPLPPVLKAGTPPPVCPPFCPPPACRQIAKVRPARGTRKSPTRY